MLIEIRGVQFVNKGAYLMLVACQQQIAKLWPEAELVLSPNANSPYQARVKTAAWQKLSLRYRGLDFNALSYFIPRAIKRRLRHSFGLVFESDIDLVLDASGFSYGDQWGGRNVQVLSNEIKRLARHQAGYILLPQALGPFSRVVDRQALQRGLPHALLVCPRDEQSYQAVQQSLGANVAAPVYQHADFTNLVTALEPSDLSSNALTNKYALIIPNSAMIGQRNKSSSWRERYLGVLTECINQARSLGLEPVVLNHEGEADAKICRTLIEQQAALFPQADAIKLITPADPRLVKGWIKNAELVFCSRFHGCVSALSSAVPCIATSWSHKYEMLFAEYQQGFAIIEADCDGQRLQELCQHLMSAQNKQVLQERAAYWHGQSELMWQQVASTVQDAICSGRIQLKAL